MTEYAVAMTFPSNSATYEAFTKLKNSPLSSEIKAAAIVERAEDGQIKITDGADSGSGMGFATGGLIGLVVGMLAGPIGMLLGWSAGAASGALVDASRDDMGEEAIGEFGNSIPPGRNAILAETDEPDTTPLDAYIKEFGGEVTRRPLNEVVAELEAQNDAAKAAATAAREEIRKHKSEERKEKVHERIEALKEKVKHL